MAALAMLCSCANQENQEKVPGIDLRNLDTSISPAEDFYAYATNGWRQLHPLSPEYSRYGSFDVLNENNQIRLNDLFKDLASRKTKEGSNERKIVDLYNMVMDSTRLGVEGAEPVKKYLAQLADVTDARSYAHAMAEFEIGAWGIGIQADMEDSNVNVVYLGQSGLELGNRDYYLDKSNREILKGYENYLEKIFMLAGYEDAAAKARTAVDFQSSIAKPSWSMVQLRDVEASYNPMSSEELFAKYPNLHLDEYFAVYGIPAQSKIIVEQPSYFEALDKMLGKGIKPEILRTSLEAALLSDAATMLSEDFYDASFEFFSRQLSGIQEKKPRWKRAMSLPNSILGEAVGQMYVEKYFPEKEKKNVLKMVKNLQEALSEHVANLDWMSKETKAKAQEKLSSYTVKIGYPDKWEDYSALIIDPQKSLYDNCVAASKWGTRKAVDKLGKPVDRTEWGMTPQTVNAYYNPLANEICFPAAILQPPFYNPTADDAVNYGAIGVVICHEMTHGFDDQGRLFDKYGNKNDWWTAEDAAKFDQKAQRLVEQFSEVDVTPQLKANGAATLGENIADQGGLRIAYTALENSFGDKHPEPIDGFTAEQRFYLSYATVWAQNITEENKIQLTLLDVHSLGENRVNVTLRNLDTFFEAFGVKEGDKMYRPESERVVIW